MEGKPPRVLTLRLNRAGAHGRGGVPAPQARRVTERERSLPAAPRLRALSHVVMGVALDGGLLSLWY
jgi:hypothetical protein